MHVVTVVIHTVGHRTVEDCIVENQHGDLSCPNDMLDWTRVNFVMNCVGKSDRTAVAGRNHHRNAHEIVRLIGQVVTGTQLKKRRWVAKEFILTGTRAVPVPANTFAACWLDGTSCRLQHEAITEDAAYFGQYCRVVDPALDTWLGFNAASKLHQVIFGMAFVQPSCGVEHVFALGGTKSAYVHSEIVPSREFHIHLLSPGLIIWGLALGPDQAGAVRTMRSLTPRDFEEAARVDGANTWQILTRVYLPMLAPSLAVLFIFQTIAIWNDDVWPLMSVGENADLWRSR
jgi:Binding-protein-dependent transport system inner membrane component